MELLFIMVIGVIGVTVLFHPKSSKRVYDSLVHKTTKSLVSHKRYIIEYDTQYHKKYHYLIIDTHNPHYGYIKNSISGTYWKRNCIVYWFEEYEEAMVKMVELENNDKLVKISNEE